VQLWETALFSLGLRIVLDVPWTAAVLTGTAMSGVYVLLGVSLVR
jgi:hypothetical protein